MDTTRPQLWTSDEAGHYRCAPYFAYRDATVPRSRSWTLCRICECEPNCSRGTVELGEFPTLKATQRAAFVDARALLGFLTPVPATRPHGRRAS